MEVTHPNPDTLRALETLVRLANKFPSLRVMQLLGNTLGSSYMEVKGDGTCSDPYYLGDNTLVSELESYEERINQMVIESGRGA